MRPSWELASRCMRTLAVAVILCTTSSGVQRTDEATGEC